MWWAVNLFWCASNLYLYRHWRPTSTREGGGGQMGAAYPALCWKSKKLTLFWKIRSWFYPSLGLMFHSKCRFKGTLEKKLQNFSLSFCLEFLTKYFSKCENSTKPSLSWTISGCAPVPDSKHLPYLKYNSAWKLWRVSS